MMTSDPTASERVRAQVDAALGHGLTGQADRTFFQIGDVRALLDERDRLAAERRTTAIEQAEALDAAMDQRDAARAALLRMAEIGTAVCAVIKRQAYIKHYYTEALDLRDALGFECSTYRNTNQPQHPGVQIVREQIAAARASRAGMTETEEEA